MKLLVVHNRYSSQVPSGENVSVDNEIAWLRADGVDVITHQASNDDAFDADSPTARLQLAARTPWSRREARRFAALVDTEKPDIVHIHNLFPLISASILPVARQHAIPIVWTARNHRLVCVDGTHYRNNEPCFDCTPGHRAAGITHGCYRDSRSASSLITAATALFRRQLRHATTVIAISRHMQSWLVDNAQLPAAQVKIKYNGVPAPAPDTPPNDPAHSRTFLFAAKLASYKGVTLLLDAWQQLTDPDIELRVVGDGPMAPHLRRAAAHDPRITWVGHTPPGEMTRHLTQARALIAPSTWAEPFGRSAAEGLAHARPVITTGLGGLSEVVTPASGWLVPTDSAALSTAIREAARSDQAIRDRSQAAAERHQQLFSPTATTGALRQIYTDALNRLS